MMQVHVAVSVSLVSWSTTLLMQASFYINAGAIFICTTFAHVTVICYYYPILLYLQVLTIMYIQAL